MGVFGLTTYLHEQRGVLAHTLSLPQGDSHTTVVVDGWSFIYELVYCADLPWVYGGEYDTFSNLIEGVVKAWMNVGMHVHFVFDGPYPAIKFPTLTDRLTQSVIHNSLLFFRTSASARSTARFLNETRTLPPLAYSVCIDTLTRLSSGSRSDACRNLAIHFADQEGDPYAVALAGRIGGYVAGRDSDFVILNTDGYRGYIPLDEMVWSAVTTVSSTTSEAGSVYGSVDGDGADELDPDGFTTVRNPKTRKRAIHNRCVGRGLLPPDSWADVAIDLTLSCTVYTPDSLATSLQIPVTLLPLLGAFVGNDYTGAPDTTISASTTNRGGLRRNNMQTLFFERQLTLSQRITRVATMLRAILNTHLSSAANGALKRRQKKPIGSVLELIDAAVNELLLRSPDSLTKGERESLVDRIVDATLQYAISPPTDGVDGRTTWASDICVLHDRDTCPLFASLSGTDASRDLDTEINIDASELGSDSFTATETRQAQGPRARVRELYLSAYRRGALSPRALDPVSTGTSWPRQFLEDPDKESVSRSIAQPIRRWCYSLLDSGVGLLEQEPQEEDNEQASDEDDDDDDDDDELIDVEEEPDEDLLAPLRGALQRLDGAPDDNAGYSTSTAILLPPPQPKIVVEYLRRSTHLATEEVSVPFWTDILDEISMTAPTIVEDPTALIQLWPEEARVVFLLRCLGSDVSSVRAVDRKMFLATLALRWTVQRMHLRARESGGHKDKEKERWTREEARAFLDAFAWTSSSDASMSRNTDPSPPSILILERSIQLTAQISIAVDAIEQFAQLLLLADYVASPMSSFSGKRFHAYLSGTRSSAPFDENSPLWVACISGIEDAFAEGRTARSKKEKKVAASAPSVQKVPAKGGLVRKGGMYDLLAQLDT